MRWRLLAVFLALVAACAQRPAPTGGAATFAYTGISPGASVFLYDVSDLQTDMAAIVDSGATWVRIDIDWSVIEPRPGRFDWRATDRAIEAARDNGLRVLGLLTYSPGWARSAGVSSHAPPRVDADFTRFVVEAGARLGGAVEAWEVWNEPNLPDFWEPRPDPARYATLLAAASEALRSVDEEMIVVTGGLGPAESDGVSIAPEEGSDETAVSLERQALILADGFDQARRWSWVGPLFVYSLRDSGTDPDDREQNFGLLTADRAPKPSWDRLRVETIRPWGRW